MLELTMRLCESLIIGDDIVTIINIRKNQIYLDVSISESLTINIHENASLRDGITIKVIRIDKDKVKLGIEAPKNVTINREEVYKKDEAGNVPSSNSGVINHTKE